MKLRTVIYMLIIVPCLGAGSWLIYEKARYVEPPDLSAAPPAELIAYLLSPAFDQQSPHEQERFIQQTMARYAVMSDAERDQVDAVVAKMRQDAPDATRDAAMKVWKGFVVSEAQQYIDTPVDQREAWIDARVAVWAAMAGQRPEAEAEKERRQREQDEKEPMSAAKQTKIIEFFQNEIYPKSTAKERALVATLMRDAGAKFRKLTEKK